MVPMLTCGLVRSNLAFATGVLLWTCVGTPYDAPFGLVRPGLLARGLRDDLLRHIAGNLGVGVELHGVARAALGLRPQVTDVAEHLRERDQGLHRPHPTSLLHRLDRAAAGVEVADDVTHVVLGSDHL